LQFTGISGDEPPIEIEGRSLLVEQSNEEFPVATPAFARSVSNSRTTHAGVMSSRFVPWHPSATNAGNIFVVLVWCTGGKGIAHMKALRLTPSWRFCPFAGMSDEWISVGWNCLANNLS